MGTQSLTFSISQLEIIRSQRDGAQYRLELPTFQRGLVWPNSKKSSLIHSISAGYPIGALLMYQKALQVGESVPTLQIIDGLQRSTAILDYLKTPLSIAPVADEFVSVETYEKIVKLLAVVGIETKVDSVRHAVDMWAEETKTDAQAEGFRASKLRRKMEEAFDFVFSNEHREEFEDVLTSEVIQKLVETFQKIKNYQVPVILYSGPEENLPDIFEALNSGTPLTKYDKFGATWSSQTALATNEKVRVAVAERYKVYIEKDWEVSDFDPAVPLAVDQLNLFEYLVGLGHVLADSNSAIFPSASFAKEAPSYAFALATLCHGIRLGDMGALPQKLSKNALGQIDLTAFEVAILDAAKLVNQKLDQYLSLKLNSRNAADRFIPHSELQVISLIARVAIEKYDPSNWQVRSSSQVNQLLENVTLHYFFDILKDNWKGSGDSKAFQRVWTENADKELIRSPYYLQRQTPEDFEQALDEFHSEELLKLKTSRPNISAKTKALLRVLYADMITHLDNKSVLFDIEHLYPIAELKAVIDRSPSKLGLPMGAFGNLAILSNNDNVIKGTNFIGDYVTENEPDQMPLEKIKRYVITPLEDIRSAKLVKGEDFLELCTSRFTAQKRIILKNLGLRA